MLDSRGGRCVIVSSLFKTCFTLRVVDLLQQFLSLATHGLMALSSNNTVTQRGVMHDRVCWALPSLGTAGAWIWPSSVLNQRFRPQ